VLARSAVHVGASGLVFCYFGYLASLALFNRSILTLLLSLISIVAYGGILRGVLPTASGVSWEGHLMGLCSGVVAAWLNSKLNSQAKHRLGGQPTTPGSADVWR